MSLVFSLYFDTQKKEGEEGCYSYYFFKKIPRIYRVRMERWRLPRLLYQP